WGHIAANVGGCHVPPVPTTFAGHVSDLKNWLRVRIGWLDNNIPGNSNNCTLGLNTPSEARFAFAFFPNPASDHITIEVNGGAGKSWISCYDVAGKRIFGKPAGPGQFGLDVSTLDPGIYIFCLEDGSGKRSFKKLVVAR
ncbi:MAG TPA: T9SS type A sorting domain-containing protein, partial [Bacteroidia bacterium]